MAIALKQLLEAGIHFGHQTETWHPKMKPYIFTQRDGIHVIDLQKTLKKFEEAYNFARDLAREGKGMLFVGTKKQAQEIIKEEALRCRMFYVNQRWLGGMLTNFSTIRKNVGQLKELEEMEKNGRLDALPKGEAKKLRKKKDKLSQILNGVREMEKSPDALFVVDLKKEQIALKEAKRLNIPVIGIVDTDCNPENVTYCIPGNDDAIRGIKLFTSQIAEAIIEGRAIQEKAIAEKEEEKEVQGPEEEGEEEKEEEKEVGGPEEAEKFREKEEPVQEETEKEEEKEEEKEVGGPEEQESIEKEEPAQEEKLLERKEENGGS